MFGNKTETYGGGLRSSKWLLLICAAVAAATDIVIISMLFAGGEEGEYLACPFLLLIFDIFYFVISLFFTDFRFKYSVAVWVSYIILYTVGFSIGNAIILGGDGTVITQSALIMWACVHAFNILCAIVCALFASRVIKRIWFAAAFAAVFIVGAAVYAGFTFSDGFFGQGTGSRTLVYTLHDSDYYSVTGVLDGRSDKVVVPETFNGKPVAAVSLSVLTKSGINDYELPASITVLGDGSINDVLNLSGKRIKIDKKAVNKLRNDFLHFAQQSGSARENAVALANATLPVNLAVNEGYVAFNYSADSYERAHGNVVPVYVGDLKNFDFAAYTQDYDYVTYRDNGSAENYYRAYNNGGYILGSIEESFNKSAVIDMEFEKVYRIKVDGGNDTKYDLRVKQPELCFDSVGGTSGYKYLTKSTAKTFLSGLTPREGFSYRWLSGGNEVTDLPKALEDGMTLSVNWRLENPVVSVSTSAQNDTITYGENVTLSSEVKHKISGIKTDYSWTLNGNAQPVAKAGEVSLTRPKPSDSAGTYKLTVIVGGDETTSLTAVAEAAVDLKINRKRVELNWSLPESMVYDGTEKSVSVSVGAGQEVEGDPISFSLMGTVNFTDAKAYNCFISLDIGDEKNYNVTNPTLLFSVMPRPVEVVWSNYNNLIYNGAVQAPTATANGVAADGALPVKVSGGQKNAGENYAAHASVSNDNYTLTNPDRTFGISKKPLTATLDNASVVYGVALGTVNITYQGFAGSDGSGVMSRPIFYTVPAIGDDDYNAGTFVGGVRCTGLNADNYSVTVVNGNLTVTPRTVTISWGMPSLVYDGAAKNVTATVINRLAGDDVKLNVSGGNGITVDTYTATVTGISGADAGNYKLPDNVTTQYTITKRTATVEWNVPQNPVYVEEGFVVTYTIDNLVESDRKYIQFVNFKCDLVGTYGMTVRYYDEEYIQTNYRLNNSSVEFTVKPAESDIVFSLNGTEVVRQSGVEVSAEITAKIGDVLSWESNFPQAVEGYYSFEGEDEQHRSSIPVSDSFTFEKSGKYEFTVFILGNSNYSGKTVILKVIVTQPEVEE